MAHCADADWVESLPIVLLGLRTAVKDDCHASSAEMVYGQTLRLPGELFVSAASPGLPDLADFTDRLRRHMQRLRFSPPRAQERPAMFVFPELQHCTHVYVRHDAVRKPLQRPYDGPYQVVRRDDKKVVVMKNGRPVTVSVDRVKPAHIDSPVDSPPRARTRVFTRSGRAVHPPVRFQQPSN